MTKEDATSAPVAGTATTAIHKKKMTKKGKNRKKHDGNNQPTEEAVDCEPIATKTKEEVESRGRDPPGAAMVRDDLDRGPSTDDVHGVIAVDASAAGTAVKHKIKKKTKEGKKHSVDASVAETAAATRLHQKRMTKKGKKHDSTNLPTVETLDCEPTETMVEDELEAPHDDPDTTMAEDEPESTNDNPGAIPVEEEEPATLNDALSATRVEDDLERGPSNDDHGIIVVDAYLPERRKRQHELIPDEYVRPYVEQRNKTPAHVVCVVLFMIVVVIGLTLGLVYFFIFLARSKETQPTESPVFRSQAPSSSLAPSDSPTFFPTSNVFSLVAEQVKTEFGIDTFKAVQDDKQSPQSKAAQWISEEDKWFTFPIDDEEERRHFRQRYALATFFYSTGGEESWIEDAKFLSDLHECEWIGSSENVTLEQNGVESNYTYYRETVCNRLTMRVMALGMDENNLTGSIPEEIWGIEDLQLLSLRNNFIGGSIPDGLYNLPELQVLYLPYNLFTGTISTLIGKLSNLKIWYTDDVNFTSTLPSEIGQLTQLTTFSVWKCGLIGTLPVEYSSLSNIEIFDVHENLLTGTLPSWVSDRPFMTHLIASTNRFTGTIPNGSYPAIQRGLFGHNMLTGTIPTSLFHGNLTTLSVQNNSLTGSLPEDLSAAPNLRELGIYINSLTGTLPPSLGQLTMLKEFSAAYNQLTGPLVDLGNCTLLSWLAVEGNELTGTIPESYSSLSKLYSFSVEQTQLVGNLTEMCNNRPQTKTRFYANCPPDVIW